MSDQNHSEIDLSIYKQIFSESLNGICVINEFGMYLDLNESFVKLLGYNDKSELIGKYFKDVTHPDDFEVDRKRTEQIFSGKIKSFELDKRFIKKDKQIVWLRLRASVFGKLGIGVLEPIEERARLEGKIANLRKDLDQFVYRTSHDLRSPVTNILGLANISDVEKKDYTQFIQMAKESAMKLDHIIKEIMDYSINHTFSIKKEEVNLNGTIDEICEEALSNQKEKKINFSKKVAHLNGVSIDRSRLSIVLSNLLANALNFTDENGHIEVEANVENEKLVVKVKDDGKGIRKDIQAKIYDMFYRGSNLSEGAGLGLYIVKDVLQEIDGQISFKSEVGEGTEFVIEIPV